MVKLEMNFQSKQSLVKVFVAIVLIAIIVNQVLWLISMHNLYQNQFADYINQSAQSSVWAELSERREEIGGFQTISLSKSNYKDSQRYINKEVIAEDSLYNVTIDRQDVHSTEKIIQMVIKDFLPINLNKLDSIFNAFVSERFAIKDSYFDYIDLNNGEIIESNKTVGKAFEEYHRTDTITLDISNSIAIIGYANISKNEVLVMMLWQLIISALLITVAIIGLLYISKSFVWQWKTEMMRQDSIYAMTHEFKRPISAAMVLAQLIPIYIERDNNATAIEYAENIDNELIKLTQYINTIKQISNSDNSNIKLDKKDVDITLLCNSIINRFEKNSTDNQLISIKLEVLTKRNMMNIDVVHFSNVIENLIENAIKYNINDTVVIEIIVDDYEDKHKVSVKDNGIGISAKSKNLIFHRYYRDKRLEVKNRLGFGLGLTYAKSIIDAHGGKITVESDLNKGSKFDIII